MNRREFLTLSSAAALAGCATREAAVRRPTPAVPATRGFHVFSKMFQSPVTKSPEELCDLMAGAGFDGVQWTVRKGGHATPENAAVELPRLCRIAASRGLRPMSICTDITAGAVGAPGLSPHAERTLGVAADCGITQFRTAYYFYDAKRETFAQSMDRIRRGFEALEGLARRTGVKAAYQNHSSWGPAVFGGLVWDIYACVRDLDPRYVGVEYDPMHALYETNLSWTHGLDLIAPWIAAVDLKDFHYATDPKNAKKMKKAMVAAGQGIVPWREVQDHLDANGVSAPYIVHFEYAFDKTDLPRAVRDELAALKKALA